MDNLLGPRVAILTIPQYIGEILPFELYEREYIGDDEWRTEYFIETAMGNLNEVFNQMEILQGFNSEQGYMVCPYK